MDQQGFAFTADNSIEEAIAWLEKEPDHKRNYFIVTDASGDYKGIVSASQLYNKLNAPVMPLDSLIRKKPVAVEGNSSLRSAIELMASEDVDVLPVLSKENQIIGILSYANIISSYKSGLHDYQQNRPHISLRRNGLKLISHGKRIRQFLHSRK